MSVGELLPGWYELRGGRSVHRVYDGGYRKMRTTCGLRIRAAYGGLRLAQRKRCKACDRIAKKVTVPARRVGCIRARDGEAM